MAVEVLYFAWVRERVGLPRERIETEAVTMRDLLAELALRSPGHAAALDDHAALRCAIDQKLAGLDAPLAGAREVAIFPPMTGG